MENSNRHHELIQKAKSAKTCQELYSLAREMGMEVSEEEAKVYFEQLHKTGELAENELDNVAGGGCHYKDGRLVVTDFNSCRYYSVFGPYRDNPNAHTCAYCRYRVHEHGLCLCDHPCNRE